MDQAEGAMGASQESEQEAVKRVLASGLFDRAPTLAALLRYICLKHFEGKSDEIKEYSIAVEALGRPDSFDKRKDSIVRVEAHRLRKRLQVYYEGSGAADRVRIVIPEGSYVPTFLHLAEPAPDPIVVSGPVAATGFHWLPTASAALLALLILCAIVWWARPRATATAAAPPPVNEPAALPEVSVPAIPVPAGRETRILAGRGPGAYVDRYGQAWDGDRFFKGGSAVTTRHQEVPGLDRNYFAAMRTGDFEYEIPLERGVYELHLFFAETETQADSGDCERNFHVSANGHPLLADFDVLRDSGGTGLPAVKIFPGLSPGPDGKLRLAFQSTANGRAFVNAIAVLPGLGARMRPIRMVARKERFTDPDGNTWLPDSFVRSGIVINRPTVPSGDPRAELYRGERYGHFTYAIPVAPSGKYTLKLYLTEFWFGPEAPGGGGERSRIFRVWCNHRLLLDDFDLFREGGGTGRGIVKQFRSLTANSQGKLVLDFEPSVNYALINALEITDETPGGK